MTRTNNNNKTPHFNVNHLYIYYLLRCWDLFFSKSILFLIILVVGLQTFLDPMLLMRSSSLKCTYIVKKFHIKLISNCCLKNIVVYFTVSSTYIIWENVVV